MAKIGKTFPLRMDYATYRRLEGQAQRFGTSVTAYIRQAFVICLEKDEASMQAANDHRGNDSNAGKAEIAAERTERRETDSDRLPTSPATAVRSFFERLTVGGRGE